MTESITASQPEATVRPEPCPFKMDEQMLADQAAFVAARRDTIGGSDVGIILGLSPWKTPFQLWLEKTGQAEQGETHERMHWGHLIEEPIAREWARRQGVTVHRVNELLRHPHYPWATANLDRRIVGVKEGLEIKQASAFVRQDWLNDGPPLLYQAQCQWYLMITEWQRWHLAALFGGNELHGWEILPSPTAQEWIWEEVTKFRRCVEEQIPPEVTAGDIDTMKALFPEADLDLPEMEIGEVMADLLRQHLEAKEEAKRWADIEADTKAKVQQLMGQRSLATGAGFKVTWKNNKASEFLDAKALAEAHPDIAQQFTKTRPGARVFRVTQQKKDQ